MEARAANVIPKHPSHGNIFSFSKHHSSKELLNKRNVVVLINLHEWVKPKLLGDPKSLLKIGMLVEMRKVNRLLRTHLELGELRIDFLEDELLLLAVKVACSVFLACAKKLVFLIALYSGCERSRTVVILSKQDFLALSAFAASLFSASTALASRAC
jgi:hypothetical protein